MTRGFSTPGGRSTEVRCSIATCIESRARTLEEAGWLHQPLLDSGEVNGVLSLSVQSDFATERDSPLVALVGMGAAATLAKLRALSLEARARQRAEDSQRSQRRLVNALVHDIRSPLGGIVAMTQVLHEDLAGTVHPESVEDILTIASCVKRICGLVDALIEEAPSPASGSCAVGPVLQGALRRAQVASRAGQHTVHVEACLGDDGARVSYDAAQLSRVLDNVMANAFKYSPEGGPVRVAMETDDLAVTLRIADEGIGVPAGELSLIFKEGGRASNVGAIAGTGIGLNTCRAILMDGGGTLSVESELGSGSEFVLVLPRPSC